MNNPKDDVTIFWFRRDLRLNDNHGLYEALKNSRSVLPIFIFDKNILNELKNKNDKRVSFIHSTLKQIQKKLIDHSSSLNTYYDEPLAAFKTICNNYSVKEVYTNHDYEPYAIKRDYAIAEWLQKKGISFFSFKDQVIFEKSEIIKSDNTPYLIFTPYSKAWKQNINSEKTKSFSSEQLLNNFYKTKPLSLLSLEDIGFKTTTLTISPLKIDNDIISSYHNTRNFPAIKGTSGLSVHLRFGTVSVRSLTRLAIQLNEQWLNELIWREFFMMILYHFPKVITESFKKKYDYIKWRNNEDEFKKWCDGKTGYPIVDAGMRELNETGLMHNRVRMIVASFLTKHLLIDWRWGEAYFAEKLLDYELSSNNGNWQWAAGCGCDAAPYFRIFNPEEQTKKFDPEMRYINKWIENFKPEYLPPIVDHKASRQRALDVFKKALSEKR